MVWKKHLSQQQLLAPSRLHQQWLRNYPLIFTGLQRFAYWWNYNHNRWCARVLTTTNVLDGGGNRLMFTWTDTLDNGIGVSAYLSFGNLNTAGARFGTWAHVTRTSDSAGDFGTVQIGANEHFVETDLIFDPSYADFGCGRCVITHQCWSDWIQSSHDVILIQSGGPVTTWTASVLSAAYTLWAQACVTCSCWSKR